MAFKKIPLTIDTMIRNPVPVEGINQEDNVELNIVVTENKTPKDLSSQTIKVYVRRIDGTLVEQTNQITLTNARKGEVTVKLKNSAFNKEGYALFQLDVSDSIGRITSSYATFKIGKGLVSGEAIANTNEIEALKKIEEYIKKANQELETFKQTVAEINENETTRQENETTRQEDELIRIREEASRNEAEALRKKNEQERNKKIAEHELKIEENKYEIKNMNLISDEIKKVGKNLFNNLLAVKGKKIIGGTSKIEDNVDYYLSDYIEVIEKGKYTNNRMYSYCYYDENKKAIPATDPPNLGGKFTITIPIGVKYIRFSVYKTLLNTTQFEKGEETTNYEPYHFVYKKEYLERHPFLTSEIPDKSITRYKVDFLENSVNLFNYKTTSERGWWVSNKTGEPEKNQYTTDYCYSDYIEIDEKNNYTINTGSVACCFYDANKSFLSYKNLQSVNIVEPVVGAKYVRFSLWYDQREKIQIEKGKKITQYQEYGFKIPDLIIERKNILNLPDKFNLVVDDTFEMFYKGILLVKNPEIYNIKINCKKGKCYSKRYIFTPTISDVGTHDMEISVFNDQQERLGEKKIKIIVKNKVVNISEEKNILCVGDSLTAGGEWVSELCRRVTKDGGMPIANGIKNVKFIGNKTGKHDCKFEGYGGWTYEHYNTNKIQTQQYWINTNANKDSSYQKSIWKDSNEVEWVLETLEENRIKVYRNVYGTQMLPSSGVLKWVRGGNGFQNEDIQYSSYEAESGNPFWDEEGGKVDFVKYAKKQSVSNIDYCYIFLGWNSTHDTEEKIKENAKIFINNLLESFPRCKIKLLGLEVPSLDGLGANYGCSWNYYDKLSFVFNYNNYLMELEKEIPEVEFINISAQFDTENNMQTSTRKVNARNSKEEVYGINGVHPANEGYMQIADAVYRNLNNNL